MTFHGFPRNNLADAKVKITARYYPRHAHALHTSSMPHTWHWWDAQYTRDMTGAQQKAPRNPDGKTTLPCTTTPRSFPPGGCNPSSSAIAPHQDIPTSHVRHIYVFLAYIYVSGLLGCLFPLINVDGDAVKLLDLWHPPDHLQSVLAEIVAVLVFIVHRVPNQQQVF